MWLRNVRKDSCWKSKEGNVVVEMNMNISDHERDVDMHLIMMWVLFISFRFPIQLIISFRSILLLIYMVKRRKF